MKKLILSGIALALAATAMSAQAKITERQRSSAEYIGRVEAAKVHAMHGENPCWQYGVMDAFNMCASIADVHTEEDMEEFKAAAWEVL
jgi:hypothetical protein